MKENTNFPSSLIEVWTCIQQVFSPKKRKYNHEDIENEMILITYKLKKKMKKSWVIKPMPFFFLVMKNITDNAGRYTRLESG